MRWIRLCLVLTLTGCSVSLPSRYEGAAPPPPAMATSGERASEAAPTTAPTREAPAKPASEKTATPPAKPAAVPEKTAAAPAKPEASAAPGKTAAAAAKPAVAAAKPAVAAAKPAVAPAKPAAAPAKPALDLRSLEERLKETNAIGILTKLSLKNQVDDLVARFKAYHAGDRPPTLEQLRPAFDLLLMKVLSLLQDKDPGLANDVHTSGDAIWGVLVDPVKFSRYS